MTRSAELCVERVSRLPVKELKRIVRANGKDAHDILERSVLVERAVQALQPGPPPKEPTLSSQLATDCEALVASEDGMLEAQRSSVVRLPKLLSDVEISQLHALAARIGDGGDSDDSYHAGAWRTTYLSARGMFSAHLSEISDKLIAAAHTVDAAQGWHLLESEAGVTKRVVEYHTVGVHGAIPWERHFDEGSFVTIDCMLSDTSEFEGGVFQTLEPDGELRPHKFERGDILIFRSHKYHCVSRVLAGRRRVLVIELWDGPERHCPHRCGCRHGIACPLEAVPMGAHNIVVPRGE